VEPAFDAMAPKKKTEPKAKAKAEVKKAAAKPEPKAEPKKPEPKAEAKKPEPKAAPKAEPKKEEVEDESKKRKAEPKADPKAEAKAKVAKKAEPKAEAKKEESKEDSSKEKETDAPADSRATVKQVVSFEPQDCTLNVLPTTGGKVLMSLSDGGMQYLIAGARANVGIMKGRYMFECKVIEALSPTDTSGGRGRVPLPRQLLRLGFSTASGSLILGDDSEGVCFDAQGTYTADKKQSNVSQRFGKDMVIACLLNLDEKSENFNTVSLFKNGERISPPQALPEALKGKALFPHVSYRNVSVQMNFGPHCISALPFKCRMIGSAAQADVSVIPSTASKDGKYEVVFPVAFPDEGSFEWLDMYLQKNPSHVELSDRKIIDWAAKSGLWKPKGGVKSSNDKPEFNYGLPSMDDFSVRRVLQTVAPVIPRNYIVMEVKENLVADDRVKNLKKFSHPSYKKVAHVVMGEPASDWKDMQNERLLKVKKEKAEAEWKKRKEEKERQKQLKERQKKLEEMRKKADEEKKKKKEEAEKKKAEEEAKKKQEAAKKKKEAEAKAKAKKKEEEKKKKEAEKKKKAEEKEKRKKEREERGEEPEEEEPEAEEPEEPEEPEEAEEEEEVKEEEKAEEKKEEPAAEEAKKDEEKEEEKEEEEEPDEPMPEVELTEEEKKQWFPPPPTSDLTAQVLNQSFGKFTIPEKSEGFDDVRFEWQQKDGAVEYLRTWVLDRKKTAKIEDLEPSQWFKEKHAAFEKAYKEWQDKQKPFKNKKAEDEKKKKKEEDAEDEDGDGDKAPEDIDIFALEDINDLGEGVPLYKDFGFEDWALVTLRWELYLLSHAFMKDVDDEERVGIHESNLAFYYNKYYKKTLNSKHYGKDTNTALLDLIKDTVTIDSEKSVLSSQLNDDVDQLDIFVKLTEECRRERQRRVDAGDETARLKFNELNLKQNTPKAAPKAAGATAWKPGAPGWKPGAGVRPAGTAWRK